MHYFERNILPDFDSSKSFRKVDVYKTLEIVPFLAYRIQSKIYDTRKTASELHGNNTWPGKITFTWKARPRERNICNEGQPKKLKIALAFSVAQ